MQILCAFVPASFHAFLLAIESTTLVSLVQVRRSNVPYRIVSFFRGGMWLEGGAG